MNVPTVALENVPHPLPEQLSVLDVREPEEWVAGHIDGAIHIPLGQIHERVQEIPEGQTLVVCKVGGRSAQAVAYLGRLGHDVVNLDGGMLSWAADGRPMVSETPSEPFVA